MSLDRTSVVVEYRVVPSFRDGTHMFDHLDSDHDGILSGGEKRAYASALVRSTRLIVDRVQVPLRVIAVSIPPRSTMSGGAGLMSVKVSAPLRLAPARAHEVTASVDYALFKRGWFIQPYYGPRLLAGGSVPVLRRSEKSFAVRISVPRSPA